MGNREQERVKKIWRVLAAVVLMGAGLAAHADEVLYWMVDNPTIAPWHGDPTTAAEYSETHPITDARIAAFLTTDTAAYEASRAGGDSFDAVIYLDLYWNEGTETEPRWVVDHSAVPRVDSQYVEGGVLGTEGKAAYAMASLETVGGADLLSTYSFAIELGAWSDYEDPNAEWILAAFSGSATYAELAGFRNFETGVQGQVPWNPGPYSVPEPTSGLLFLIGGALLALKRKRV